MRKAITIYGLTAILLVGLTTSVFAQSNNAMQQHVSRDMERQIMMSFWSGGGSNNMWGMLHQDDIREGLGISREQLQNIQDTKRATLLNDPCIRQGQEEFQKEMFKLMAEHGNPFDENASEETRQRFTELQEQMQMEVQAIVLEKQDSMMAHAINENLTSDQLKRIGEFQISIMSEFPLISPSMFEVLDLSDDQKRQLDEIKKAMEPEYERHIDRMIDFRRKSDGIFQEILDKKLEGVIDSEEQERIRRETAADFRRTNQEFLRGWHETMESGKELADRLKIRMFDVLTDEQWERTLYLIDNPPDFAKPLIARMRERREAANASPGEWQPGPGSWRPGDAIPEAYRIERNTRRPFPRTEN